MKKLAAILCLSALTTGAFAQGTINFQNSGQTLVTATINGNTAAIGNSTSGSTFYFGLLISPSTGAANFTFTGLYATNTAATTGGRLGGGNGIPVPGWGGGVVMNYELVGWSSTAGHDFNTAWVNADGSVGNRPQDLFGISSIGTGAAGGLDAGGNALPTYNLFGGNGITSGFNLTGATVPEPTSMALAGLGAAALLIFRRRK
jgi:hypothetical protein